MNTLNVGAAGWTREDRSAVLTSTESGFGPEHRRRVDMCEQKIKRGRESYALCVVPTGSNKSTIILDSKPLHLNDYSQQHSSPPAWGASPPPSPTVRTTTEHTEHTEHTDTWGTDCSHAHWYLIHRVTYDVVYSCKQHHDDQIIRNLIITLCF